MTPALDQPAAKVRAHLVDVCARSKALAGLLRKAPEPHVALAAQSNKYDWFALFTPLPVIQAPNEQQELVSLSWLLDSAAASLAAVARDIPRARQNRQPAKSASDPRAHELRLRAAHFLVGVFRKWLGHPYHAHVATIATVVSGIETDADFVKKVEARQTEPGEVT